MDWVRYMKDELTKSDWYEIEKILDIYAGMINDTLNRYCQTATHVDAMNTHTFEEPKMIKSTKGNPMEDVIKDLVFSREQIKRMRQKLEKMRLKNYEKRTKV